LLLGAIITFEGSKCNASDRIGIYTFKKDCISIRKVTVIGLQIQRIQEMGLQIPLTSRIFYTFKEYFRENGI